MLSRAGDLGRQLVLDFEGEAEDWREADVIAIFGPREGTAPDPAEQEREGARS